ncbi:HPr-rel-A system PqqD family peptide chaperone [Conexibacter sp. SYSU D00693]|uniref:HPr-rel-A system PqqD family peptide chaperone n=1 Tax=Conexibacter sp. SYSU D00693 TaxID=2812560 RepID=UPI00196AB706|nr:HPr-rel-A system PqqD family peptide chaperone [Conexibacter sp. SYSU D00693]
MLRSAVGSRDEERDELPNGRVRIPDHVVHRSFDEETVLLNLETGQYHGLNQVAGRMLEALEATGDAEDSARRVAAEFDVPVERVEHDLAQLLGQLRERGLVVVDER